MKKDIFTDAMLSIFWFGGWAALCYAAFVAWEPLGWTAIGFTLMFHGYVMLIIKRKHEND